MKDEKFVPRFLGYYLICLGLARISRICFWTLQVKAAYNQDSYYTLIISDLFYLVLVCDFVYNFFKHRNSNLIPYN